MIFFLKLLGKIAVVFKAAAFGDFLYAAVCVQKHLGSCLKPVAIQVTDWRCAHDGLEASEDFGFTDRCCFREIFNCYFIPVTEVNVIQQSLHPFFRKIVVSFCEFCPVVIIPQVIQNAGYEELGKMLL